MRLQVNRYMNLDLREKIKAGYIYIYIERDKDIEINTEIDINKT